MDLGAPRVLMHINVYRDVARFSKNLVLVDGRRLARRLDIPAMQPAPQPIHDVR